MMSTENDPSRTAGEAGGGVGADTASSPRSGWRRILSLPGLLATAAVTASVGFLINQFGPGAVEKVQDREPVRATAEYDWERYGDGWTMATPTAIAPASAPSRRSTHRDVGDWVMNAGGALVEEAWLRLLLEGRRSGGLVIKSMRARSLRSGEPYTGSLVTYPSAGESANVAVGFDLDSPSPVARSMDANGDLGRPYFSEKSITLAKGEKMSFNVVGKATRSSHRWVIDVDVELDGETKTYTVGGRGYAVTPKASTYRTAWEWAWHQQPPGLVPDESSAQELGPDRAETDASAPASSECTNARISPSDRSALSEAAGTSEAALPGSVYFGTCSGGEWAIARFPGEPADGVFRRDGEQDWVLVGSLEAARCRLPPSLREAWKLPAPC